MARTESGQFVNFATVCAIDSGMDFSAAVWYNAAPEYSGPVIKSERMFTVGFEKAFNKFAKSGTALNRKVNQVIGKEVFKDIREIEPEREYQPYDSFPDYPEAEPPQWAPLTGSARQFALQGQTLCVSEAFDACMQYRSVFRECARYYADRFQFKYAACVSDFDTLVHYFPEMYQEGLTAMAQRAHSLLLPFGVFSMDLQTFSDRHIEVFQRAIRSWETMAGIEASRNQQAKNTGDTMGNLMHFQGGGFGMKGAAKGILQAEGLNLGMKAIGKYVETQTRMTQEDKAKVYAAFRQDLLFEEVRSDYENTFLTLLQILSDSSVLGPIHTVKTGELETLLQNIQNPMFPPDRLAETFVRMLASYPLIPECHQLLAQKLGDTEEVRAITAYFLA